MRGASLYLLPAVAVGVSTSECRQRCQTPLEIQMRTARFWVWANDGWVKLALRNGQTLTHSISGPTDEGYFSQEETWSRDGDHVFRSMDERSRDCDGPHELHVECVFGLSELGSRDMHSEEQQRAAMWGEDPKQPQFNENIDIYTPEWTRVSSSQRDAYAEAMGY